MQAVMATDHAVELDRISLDGIGKKFRDQWIFRNITLDIFKGDKIALTGYNGSGKSTLLQLVSGYVSPSAGRIQWFGNEMPVPAEILYKHISFAAPYLDLIEDFTLEENVAFYAKHKKFTCQITPQSVIIKAQLEQSVHKLVRNFSSGMKQRLKLALACFTDAPLLLLDEPLSNLDVAGCAWYRELVKEIADDRIVIICSNKVEEETYFCSKHINLEEFKTK
jgi:ABC-type multidrug transport system ATPase subunit